MGALGKLTISCLLLVILSVQAVICAEAAKQKPPHIVYILADDLGWDDVSFHGSSQIHTPNIDALALGPNGIPLHNYYVQPICTPSRAALLTGRYPIHLGMQHGVIMGTMRYGLPLNVTLLPEHLRRLGYATHVVGKWHLGFFRRQHTPTYRGFHTHYGFLQGAGDYWDHSYFHGGDHSWGYDFRDSRGKNMSVLWGKFNNYSTDVFTDEAVRLINETGRMKRADPSSAKPLFLYLSHQAVHAGTFHRPLTAPDRFLKQVSHIQNKDRRLYAGMVLALDESVGRVMKALKSAGIYDKTIIVFSSDNGGPVLKMDAGVGTAASNWPLRGAKHTLWEGGVRAVGIIHSKLLNGTGRLARSKQLVHITDWLPTLMAAAGVRESDLPKNLDGFNLWPSLGEGKAASPRRDALLNVDPVYKNAALRSGRYKLIYGRQYYWYYDGWYPTLSDEKHNSGQTVDKHKVSALCRICLGSSWHTLCNLLCTIDKNKNNDKSTSKNKGKMWLSIPKRINCGQRPKNVATNCEPEKSPCLFDIESDPCEFRNIAAQHKDIVKTLMNRIDEYKNSSLPLENKPYDVSGSPLNHGGVWGPWVD